MGSEFYAHLVVQSEHVASRELDELVSDIGADLPQQDGAQITARLDAASRVPQGAETELWLNTEPESGKTLLGPNGSGAAAA
jgi:multiple sugar transport system ATP-binding protein